MKVSLVLRTLNESKGLQALVPVLANQTRQVDEIIVVDSGSTDDTVAQAQSLGAQVIEIPKEEFSFGGTLNIGTEAARGDVIVSLSAHCLPVDEHWIERLVAPFEREEVLAVYGRQVPFDDASVMERRGLLEAYPERKFGPVEMFSNAHCAFRRSAWEAESFDAVLTGSEDIEWANRIRLKPENVVYASESLVYHSHQETLGQIKRRFYREMLAFRQFDNGFVRSYGFLGMLLRMKKAIVLDYLYLLRTLPSLGYGLKWGLLIPAYRAAAYYGQYQAIVDSRR